MVEPRLELSPRLEYLVEFTSKTICALCLPLQKIFLNACLMSLRAAGIFFLLSKF